MALESLPKIAPALFSAEQDLIQIYNKKTDTFGVVNASLLGGSTPPSGVSGAIQFSTGSAFGSDSANLFWDDTNNRLGVGTNAPTKNLEVNGTTRVNDEFSITNSGVNARYLQVRRASGWLCFGNTAGSESIAMNGSNLLIGTTPDNQTSTRLQITGSGSTSATTSLLVQNSGGTNTLSITDDNISTFNGNINFTGGSAATQRQILFQSQGIKIKHNLNGLGNNTFIGWNNDALPLDSTTQRSTIIGFLNQGNVPSESTIVGVNNNLTDYVGGTTTIFGSGIRLNASSGGGKFIGCDGTVKVGFNGLFASDNGSVSLFPPSTYVSPQAGPTIIGAGVNNADIQFPSICLGQWASDSTYPTGVRNNHLSTTNGSGTNVEGYNLHIMPGRSTGNATPKDLIFNTTNIGSSGTSYQSYVSRWWIKGGTGTLANTATPDATACLQADSTTKGFLPPRMTNAQRLLITTPAVGLMVYCTDAVEGLYVYKSTGWTFVI